MSKYRKKPVAIEAIPVDEAFDAGQHNWDALPQWLAGAYEAGNIVFRGDGSIEIRTLEGVMLGSPGDFIIQGVKGELYPCKPDIFHATYESVDE